jgi:hypothetical protein
MRVVFFRILVLALTLASFSSLTAVGQQSYARTELPPLLQFLDGREVNSPQDWKDRKKEIRSLLQKYFTGTFPPETPHIVSSIVVSDESQEDGSRRRRIRVTWSTPNEASFEMALWTPE